MDTQPTSPNLPTGPVAPEQGGLIMPEQAPAAPEVPAAAEVAPAPAAPAQVAPAAVPVAPVAPQPAQAVPAPAAAPQVLPGTPAAAGDVDVIEPEWVDKADEVVRAHQGDPYGEEEAIEKLQEDYLQKRYGIHVADPNGPSKPAGS